ncbi:cytochrome P450 [Aspergillus pseudoustus]|uniref:Cytochrome P450 n=1 Tax=Aspergillus pseudoustus TaxID=1810923 RepID=A0ABR4JWF1_9EURO
MLTLPVLVAIACLAAVFQLTRFSATNVPKGAKLLPGPRGKPFIGSGGELKKGRGGYFWFKFTDWAKEYGPIYQYKTFGRVNVVLSTEGIANDLLRERGDIFSSREQLPMGSKLLSDNKRALFLPYGDDWRRVRKFQHHVTQVKAATSYQSLQMKESARLVRDLVKTPRGYKTFFQRYASALILRLTYDARIETGEEEIVRLVYENQVNMERVSVPGRYLVDILPCLLWLPSWVAPFKKEAAAHQRREVSLFSSLVKSVQDNIEAGKAGQSFTRMWLENKQKFGLSDIQGTYVLGGLYSAAASTTASLAQSWVLQMVLHPEWLAKIHEELDRVVGPDRLPVFDDMPQLPTVRAVVKEVARMRPVTAGGIPHKSTEDFMYMGYLIPKGSIIHPNLWAIQHDPELYPDPFTFNPCRWLEPKYPTYREPLTQYPNMNNYSVFGFGRRLCPGAHIAERSLNIIVARVSWACNIRTAVDGSGKEIIPPEYDYVNGLNTEPHDFEFDLTCRSPEHQEVLEREAEKAIQELRQPESGY